MFTKKLKSEQSGHAPIGQKKKPFVLQKQGKTVVSQTKDDTPNPKYPKSQLFRGNNQIFFTLNRGTRFDHQQGHIIGVGSVGSHVVLIIRALNSIYSDDPNYTPLPERTYYDEKLRKAVSKFQIDNNLQQGTNGAIGPETIEKLDAAMADYEKMTFDPNEMFAIELINEAIKKRKPNDPDAINYFWNWYHSLEDKPSFAELADYVMTVNFDYLNTKQSKLLMFGLSSGAATMLSKAGKLNSPDAMDSLIAMSEKDKQKAFLSSTEETIAILLMEFGTGKGKELRKFNEDHELTQDIMSSTTTAWAYRAFYDEIEAGKIDEGEEFYVYQGYHNRASTKLESLRIHLQSIMQENYGEFFRGGMEYWMKIEGDQIVVLAKDKYTEDSGIRSGSSRQRFDGFETPFGTTYIEVRWKVPVEDILLNFKGLDYYKKNK